MGNRISEDVGPSGWRFLLGFPLHYPDLGRTLTIASGVGGTHSRDLPKTQPAVLALRRRRVDVRLAIREPHSFEHHAKIGRYAPASRSSPRAREWRYRAAPAPGANQDRARPSARR